MEGLGRKQNSQGGEGGRPWWPYFLPDLGHCGGAVTSFHLQSPSEKTGSERTG